MTTTRRLRSRDRRRQQRSSANPGPWLVGAGAAASAFFFLADYNSPASRQYRQLQQIAKQERTENQLADLRATREAEVAHGRYQGGCTMLTSLNVGYGGVAHEAIAITAQTPYIDPETGGYLPPGQIVCDDKFVTGVIGSDGTVDPETIARATDGDLVNKRFADALGWHPDAKRSSVGF